MISSFKNIMENIEIKKNRGKIKGVYLYIKSYILASDGPEKLKMVSKDCFDYFLYVCIHIYKSK